MTSPADRTEDGDERDRLAARLMEAAEAEGALPALVEAEKRRRGWLVAYDAADALMELRDG